jgi:hypothetical protein
MANNRIAEIAGVILSAIIANAIGLGLVFLSLVSLIESANVRGTDLASWQLAGILIWALASIFALLFTTLFELGVAWATLKAFFVNGFRIVD